MASDITYRALFVGLIRYDESLGDFLKACDRRELNCWPNDDRDTTAAIMVGDYVERIWPGGGILLLGAEPARAFTDADQLDPFLREWDAT